MASRGKLASQVAFWVVLSAVLAGASQAAVGYSALLNRSQSVGSVFSINPDLITAYSTEMVRSRLELTARGAATDLATVLTPMQLRPEFRTRTWRAEDGSLLQGLANKGGFRLTRGNCLSLICVSLECVEDEWPSFACSDKRKRKMSVKDFTTTTFDGITFRRLSAPPTATEQVAAGSGQ